MSAGIKLLEEIAGKMRAKISFAYSDGVEYKEQLTSMGGDDSKLPSTAGLLIEERKNFPYTGAFEATALLAWCQGILDGSVQPHFKSDPIPEVNDGPVYVVVGKSFESVVLDETKDVLLEFYAPWCGHCKTLAPKYDNVGKHFKGLKNLVIAKIDATTNETPIAIEGFPTLYFFPKGGKKEPLVYEGARSEKAIISYLKTHAVAAKDEIAAMATGKKEEL